MKSQWKMKLGFAAALAAVLCIACLPVLADIITAKAGSSGVTKGLAVKFSAAGTIATASAATDEVVGVCEQTASASAITKYSGAGTTTTVTSGEAVTAGNLVTSNTAGKAVVYDSRVRPERRVLGIALSTVAAADKDLKVQVITSAGVSTGAVNPYQIDATALYAVGARYIDATDGRVWRYALCGTAGWAPGYGAFTQVTLAIGENIHANAAIGDTTLVIEEASIAANAWAGGYLVVGHGAQARTHNRRVVSNTASASSTNHVTVTLDGALTVAVTTADYCEIIPNIYSNCQTTTSEFSSVVGVPASVATTGQHGWIQTWGPCWIVPGGSGTPGSTAMERTLYFVGDCSANGDVGLKDPTTEPERRQVAGFIIQKDSSGSGGPPFVMLQISP